MKRVDIYAFGDSITYGAWDKEKGGWANRLRLAYETQYPNDRYTVFNLGISGEITSEVNTRFDKECSHRFKPENTPLIILAVGINDSQDDNDKDRVTLDEFRTEVATLIKKAKKYTNNILFLGLTNVDETRVAPIPWHLEKCYYNHKIKAFDAIIEEESNKHQIQYLHLFDVLTIEDLSDGLHPNEVGHQKLCNVIKEKIDLLI